MRGRLKTVMTKCGGVLCDVAYACCVCLSLFTRPLSSAYGGEGDDYAARPFRLLWHTLPAPMTMSKSGRCMRYGLEEKNSKCWTQEFGPGVAGWN